MKPKIPKPLAVGAVTLGLFAGAAGIAAATTGQSGADTATTPASASRSAVDHNEGADEGNDAGETRISGSIAAPAEQQGAEEDSNAEQAALAGLAKISEADAKTAALAAAPGTVNNVRLEDEDGFVVYAVEVTTANGLVEVKIDAGNGKVLAQEAGDEHDGRGDAGRGHSNSDPNHEANETPERAAQEAKQDAARN